MKPIPSEKQQEASQSRTYSRNYLPEGSCSIKNSQTILQYENILSYPLLEYLTFPAEPKFFPCIIVKQDRQSQQPIYHLYYQIAKRRLLSAQKQPNNIGCNYIVSKKQKPKKDQYFVGKLRGNFRNNQFTMYDGGENPKKKCVRKRRQFAFIKFNEENISNKTQQIMEAYVPQIQQTYQSTSKYPKYHPKEFIPNQQKQNMILQKFNKNAQSVIRLKQNHKIMMKRDSFAKAYPSGVYFESLKQVESKIVFSLHRDSNQEALSLVSRSYPLNLIQGFGLALSIIQRSLK